jgi:hypothetical protein
MRTLKEEIAQLRAEVHQVKEANSYLNALAREGIERADKAESALREYGQHKPDCQMYLVERPNGELATPLIEEGCTCGFSALQGDDVTGTRQASPN